ncbi:DNA-binding response regulator [Chromobacterium sphagni]|uniref:DNA-binding response regulator n=1 Tax=Chromobacterium sphagni TaxID=1903179 RepID=A0A1S1WWS9_9NEIS|nr:response regulator transcription factor [Chromobacterium sphagni]OHX11587.1 DNA-binding response regulator [Chromobacterium sphagni]
MTVLKPPLRLMLLDDHAVVLQGLSYRLSQEPDFAIVGAHASSKSLLSALRKQTTDVIVLDYSLQPEDIDGLNLIRALTTRFPQTAVLIMSAHYNTATVALALRGGARGFVGKQQDLDELVTAIRTLAQGQVYLNPAMATELASAMQAESVPAPGSRHASAAIGAMIRLSELSPKEQEVIRCFMEGMTVSQIAEKFARSIKTISGQKQTAMRKLGLKADHELYILRDELNQP